MKIRKQFIEIIEMCEIPHSFKARFNGCYFNSYRMIYQLKNRGIIPRTIFDIGANMGQLSRCFSFVFPYAQIYAFEPLPSCYAELKRLSKKKKNIIPYQTALGDKNGEIVMFKNDYHYSSSILPMLDRHKQAFPYTKNCSKIKVEITKLDDIAENLKLVSPILIKIDVQGYEEYVLKGAQDTLLQTDFLMIELSLRPLYEGGSLFIDILMQLAELGFVYAGQLDDSKHPMTNEILQVDGFFINSDRE